MLLDGLHAFKDWHEPKFDSVNKPRWDLMRSLPAGLQL